MSQYTYSVFLAGDGSGDINSIRCNELNRPVPWTNADFQAWNAAQLIPYVLSEEQIQLAALKNLTAAQLVTATPAQVGLILKRLLQVVNTGVV